MNTLVYLGLLCMGSLVLADHPIKFDITCPEDDGKPAVGVIPFNITAGNCEHYCEVSFEKVRLRKCPENMQYSLDTNTCESAREVGCPGSRCMNQQYNLMYVRANSCSQYYACGSTIHYSFWRVCILGQVFDVRKNHCTWDQSKCRPLY